jgi:hypothetical protein
LKAGEIEINVIANYAALDGQLAEVVTAAGGAGGDAGDNFGAKFQSATERYAERTAMELRSKLTKAVGALAIGQALNAGLKAAAEGGDWAESLANTIKSIPVANIAYELMENLGNLLTGSARDSMEALELEAEAKAQKIRAKFLQDRQGAPGQQEEALATARARAELSDAKRLGDARKVADKEAVLAFRELDSKRAKEVAAIEALQRKELATLTRDVQRAEAKERHQAELDAVLERYRVEYDQIVKNRQASFDMASENDRKLAEKKAEDERKVAEAAQSEIDDMIAFMEERSARAAEEIAAETQKSIDAMTKQADDLEEQRMAAAQEQGTAQTAFGAFRFSAYTDAEKKQNDQSILTEIRSIRREVGSLQTSGGPM